MIAIFSSYVLIEAMNDIACFELGICNQYLYLQKHFVITNNLLLQIDTFLPVYFVQMICIFYLLICYQQAALCSVVCGPSVVSPSTPTPTSSLLCLIISIKHDFSSIHPTFHLPYTVVLISMLYFAFSYSLTLVMNWHFVFLNNSYKSWWIIKTRDSFGICSSRGF